ncbi:hypothetical protein EJ08DRAFT_679043 [Tothia fuscella]|uniref:Cell wall mannoprotein PIR1-like C-terminal domain-containing protein n=1 Tax=Tothia fuscella TaxID=1048955 RepID=A0A9P4NRT2_9PEZI|nr:hypothetical protein EJ08DRAFT_679043 [Tothia fuscella]
MRRIAILLAVAATGLATPFPAKDSAKAPKSAKAEMKIAKAATTSTLIGEGTGVTWKIAPSAPAPPGCTANLSGKYQLAINAVDKRKDAVLAASSSVSKVSSLSSAISAASSQIKVDTASPASGAMSAKPAALVTSVPVSGPSPASDVPVPKPTTAADVPPPPDGDTTVTLRSTRTQTRTVTVRRTVVGQRPVESASPASASPGKPAKMGRIIQQIPDGQIQAPTKPVKLPAPPTEKSAPAGSKAVPTKAMTTGQIQAPPIPAVLTPAAKPASATAPKPAISAAVPNPPPAPQASPQGVPAPAMAPPAPSSMAPMAGMSGHDGMNMHRRDVDTASFDVSKLPLCMYSPPPAGGNPQSKPLNITLVDGVIKDDYVNATTSVNGRTGYIASNFQFQFDGPPQAGAIFTAGFSVCNDGKLALGDKTTWVNCPSGNGDGSKFGNLYDRVTPDWESRCSTSTVELFCRVA